MKIFLQTILGLLAGLFGLLILAPVWILAILISLFSKLVRVAARWREAQYLEWNELIDFDEKFGWKPAPNLKTHHLVDDVYRITTDGDGWRSETSLDECNLVVIGDSFAWGFGIDDKDFFANRVTSPRIKSVGALGYNMVQELMWLETLGERLRGKTVVWMIFYGNDLWENLLPHMLGYRMPFVRRAMGSDEWEIVNDHLAVNKWFYAPEHMIDGLRYFETLAELCAPTRLASRAFSACSHLLQQGKNLCDRYDARLVVMGIPERIQYQPIRLRSYLRVKVDPDLVNPDYPDEQLKKVCAELGISFVPLKNHLDLTSYKERDCHWNSKGHEQVAELLKRIYQEQIANAASKEASLQRAL